MTAILSKPSPREVRGIASPRMLRADEAARFCQMPRAQFMWLHRIGKFPEPDARLGPDGTGAPVWKPSSLDAVAMSSFQRRKDVTQQAMQQSLKTDAAKTSRKKRKR